MKTFLEQAREWCRGKFPFLRLILWIYFVLLLFRYIKNPDYQCIFKPLDLGIHELGHIVLIPLATLGSAGEFIEILGGSMAQLLVPIIGIVMFYQQQDFFAISVGMEWFAINIFDVATYVADARTMALTLVSPFGADAVHDWNYILSRIGMLNMDTTFATIMRIFGFITFGTGLLFGGWLILCMVKKK